MLNMQYYAEHYGVDRNPSFSYPLDRSTGGVYSTHVTVFRGLKNTGYMLLRHPYRASVISVPAINGPDLEEVNGEWRIVPELVEPSREKIRTIV